ncbi:MAG TPA: putative porin [Bradyrhizobium sp.]|nr:putative porin [Bradyrhizobium sp.]
MFRITHPPRRALPLAVSLCAMLAAAPAFGQGASGQGASGQGASDQGSLDQKTAAKKGDGKPKLRDNKPVSSNATVNLVNLLVKQGVIKGDQAEALIKQAEDEAYVSRQAAKDATAKADDAAKAAATAAAEANPPGTKHVTYVPEVVKRELREEIKKEVMAKAEKENWASPGLYPEWAQRIHFYGDFRLRYQGNFFPAGNDQMDAINFNTINTGSPYDVSSANTTFPPTYDATQNREQVRLRARLGMDADLSNGFTAGFRIATGADNSPVSTNQTLGAGSGDFSKYAVWLDRGYLKWETPNLAFSTGRFDNPFFSPTDLVWYKELAFDGFAAQAKYEVSPGITPFVVGGAFPIFNTALNAGINTDPSGTGNLSETPSHDKWLFGVQGGVIAKIEKDINLTVGAAYYDFTNVQGEVSTPCLVTSSADACDTDITRPLFAQKGNSYLPLRTLVYDIVNINSAGILANQYQYFGLASQFRPIVVSGQLDFAEFNPTHIILDGEYVNNTAFDRGYLNAWAVNNRAPTSDPNATGIFDGGNQGWLGRVTVGDKEIKHLWDWNVHAGYKYLESDATVDAFTDSDFGLGGTNLKGYFLGGNVGLGENVWATLRWMSANNISGVPYAVDVLQVDLNARF